MLMGIGGGCSGVVGCRGRRLNKKKNPDAHQIPINNSARRTKGKIVWIGSNRAKLRERERGEEEAEGWLEGRD